VKVRGRSRCRAAHAGRARRFRPRPERSGV